MNLPCPHNCEILYSDCRHVTICQQAKWPFGMNYRSLIIEDPIKWRLHYNIQYLDGVEINEDVLELLEEEKT